jgi:hypothetical protein
VVPPDEGVLGLVVVPEAPVLPLVSGPLIPELPVAPLVLPDVPPVAPVLGALLVAPEVSGLELLVPGAALGAVLEEEVPGAVAAEPVDEEGLVLVELLAPPCSEEEPPPPLLQPVSAMPINAATNTILDAFIAFID